jgi:hypothetical protein
MANIDKTINYIEFPLVDAEATKAFYSQAFGWEFTNWGPEYLSFTGGNVEGGFNGVDGIKPANISTGVLVVLYAEDLAATVKTVEVAGGKILKPIFSFPGGRRFHFIDPNGNELAVWSE